MPKPTFVFCHGAWHNPSFFDKVISILEPLGYTCVTFSFPGTGNVPAVKSLDEDIAAVRAVVLREVVAGSDVIVSAHSWGGVPACSALDGLSKTERQRDGKVGGVVRLAFVTSFILPEETSISDVLGGPLPIWVPDAVNIYTSIVPRALLTMFHRTATSSSQTRSTRMFSITTFRLTRPMSGCPN